MPEPKFKNGDYVYIAQEVKAYNENGISYSSLGSPKPLPYMIIGILQETCYAGTQVHYTFRGFGPNGTILWKVLEIEVTNVPPIQKDKV